MEEVVRRPEKSKKPDAPVSQVLTDDNKARERGRREAYEMAVRRAERNAESDAVEQGVEGTPKISVDSASKETPEAAAKEVREETVGVLVVDEVEKVEGPESEPGPELDLDEGISKSEDPLDSEMPELNQESSVPDEYLFGGIDDKTLLGEGLECRGYRGEDSKTGQPILMFKAKRGKEAYLQNRAAQLAKMSGTVGFLKLLQAPDDDHFMICEDPGTVPLEKKLDDLSLASRMDLVKQFADRLVAMFNKDLLHRDLRPDQLYLDEEVTLYLSDLGVAGSVDSESVFECSLEDPSHAKAISHYKAVFASADVAEAEARGEDFQYDAKAEVEVFAKVAACLLSRLVPSRGVEAVLKKLENGNVDTNTKLEDLKLCIKRAAAEREERIYRSIVDFSHDISSPRPLTEEEWRSFHSIVDCIEDGSFDCNDDEKLDRLISAVNILMKGDVQFARDDISSLKELADQEPEAGQNNSKLQELRVVINTALPKLEANESAIVEELRKLEESRYQKGTSLEPFLLECLDHPSEQVRAAAVKASGIMNTLTHEALKMSADLERRAREVLFTSVDTKEPGAWKATWEDYFMQCVSTLEYKNCSSLTKDCEKQEKDILMRMLTEGHIRNLYGGYIPFFLTEGAMGYYEPEDIERIKAMLLEDIENCKGSFDNMRLHVFQSFQRIIVGRIRHSGGLKYSDTMSEQCREMVLKAQEIACEYVRALANLRGKGFMNKTVESAVKPLMASIDNDGWHPDYLREIFEAVAEAPIKSPLVDAFKPDDVTDRLGGGNLPVGVAVKALSRLRLHGKEMTVQNYTTLVKAHVGSSAEEQALIIDFLSDNLDDPQAVEAVKGSHQNFLHIIIMRKHHLLSNWCHQLREASLPEGKLESLDREAKEKYHEIVEELEGKIHHGLEVLDNLDDKTSIIDFCTKQGLLEQAVKYTCGAPTFSRVARTMEAVCDAAFADSTTVKRRIVIKISWPFVVRRYDIKDTVYDKWLGRLLRTMIPDSMQRPIDQSVETLSSLLQSMSEEEIASLDINMLKIFEKSTIT